MGTMLHVAVWEADDAVATASLRAARDAVTRLDSLLSNYRADSDVTRVNGAAGSGEWVHVAEETADMVALSLEFARETSGAFDPTVGPVVDTWGFYRETGAIPPPAALDSARALIGWQRVEVARDPARVRLPAAGMRLDFGAIGKGYAVDAALAAARAAGARRVMVDLGGNIGVTGGGPDGAWPIGLRHPRYPELPFAVVDLQEGDAVATSGDYERFFVHDGVRYAHIIDPRTGWPVQEIASVSALAPNGTISDVLSTTLFVVGVERGCALIADLPGVAAVWVLAPGVGETDTPLRAVVGGPAAHRIEVGSGLVVSTCDDAVR